MLMSLWCRVSRCATQANCSADRCTKSFMWKTIYGILACSVMARFGSKNQFSRCANTIMKAFILARRRHGAHLRAMASKSSKVCICAFIPLEDLMWFRGLQACVLMMKLHPQPQLEEPSLAHPTKRSHPVSAASKPWGIYRLKIFKSPEVLGWSLQAT